MSDAPAPQGNQTTQPKTGQTLDPPELARLRIEKAISDQELAIAENQRKRIQAILPSDVKALEGTTKVEGDHPIESQILAHRALDELAQAVAIKVAECNPAPTTVIIHSEAEINALLALRGFVAQIALIENHLKAEITNAQTAIARARAASVAEQAAPAAEQAGRVAELGLAAPLAPLVVGGVLRSAADMLSLFRVNVALKYKDLTIGDLALVTAVAGHLASRPNPIAVYHPALLPPNLTDQDSAIRTTLETLITRRGEIDSRQAEVTQVGNQLKQQIEALTQQIAAGEAANPKLDTGATRKLRAEKQSASDRLSTMAARLQAASSSFDAFQGALLKADESSGINALVRVLKAEKLAALAADAHWLLLKVAVAGGGYKTKQFLWWTTNVLYSGGAITEFALFNASGTIVAAGCSPKYSGFIRVNERTERTSDLSNLTVTGWWW